MKMTSNERLGALLILILAALVGIGIGLSRLGPAPAGIMPSPPDTIVMETPAAQEPKAKKTKRTPKQPAPAPAERDPLDEVF